MYLKILCIIILFILIIIGFIFLFKKSSEKFEGCAPLDQCHCNSGCPDGVQCIPKSDATTKIPTVDKTIIDGCATYSPGKVISWENIAKDWMTGGGAKEDCAAALIIASGETSCTKDGCNAVQGGI